MRRMVPVIAALIALAATAAGPASADWTTYRHDMARSGIDPDSGSPLPPSAAWTSAPLDGSLWGQPLVAGGRVYVATENDTVTALDAATGTVVWSRHLGTAVPATQLPCGDITPLVGITSTPVIDPASGVLYAVGLVWDGSNQSSIAHRLFALDTATGTPGAAGLPAAGLPVDPPYPAGGSALQQLQRPALALSAGRVIVGYGGNDGDCGTYWGWLVSAPATGTGPLAAFQADSAAGHHGGAVWGAGAGPAVDSAGDVFAATGNGYSNTSFDSSESVLRLDPVTMARKDFWAPANWAALDAGDTDIGSSEPVPLGATGLLAQTGKDGEAYVVRAAALGGIGAPAAQLAYCSGKSFGGDVFQPATETLYASCDAGLAALKLDPAGPGLTRVTNFTAPSAATGPPVIAGGLVWVVGAGSHTLYGLDPATGHAAFTAAAANVVHFATASAGGGRLFLGDGTRVDAYAIATPPPPPAVPGPTPVPSPPAPPVTPVRSRAPARPAARVRLLAVRLSPARVRRGRAVILGFTLTRRTRVAVALDGRVVVRAVLGPGRHRLRLSTRRLRAGSRHRVTVTATVRGLRPATVRLRLRLR